MFLVRLRLSHGLLQKFKGRRRKMLKLSTPYTLGVDWTLFNCVLVCVSGALWADYNFCLCDTYRVRWLCSYFLLNGISFVCSAVSFVFLWFFFRHSFSVALDIVLPLCVCLFKSTFISCNIKTWIGVGAVSTVVHKCMHILYIQYFIPYDFLLLYFFCCCFVIISLSFQYMLLLFFILLLLLLLLSLFTFDASGIPKVELKCVCVCVCGIKIRKSEKWNRLHRKCNGYRELLLLLVVGAAATEAMECVHYYGSIGVCWVCTYTHKTEYILNAKHY